MRYADLEAFLAVARTRSFRRAAQERGVTGPALSQSVRNLEEELGLRLLNRTTRSVSPTEAGELLVSLLEPAFEDVQSAIAQVKSLSGQPSGVVRVSVPAPALEHLIMPHAPAFLAAYPRVSLELISDARVIDIVAEGFDAGVRLGLEMANDMIAMPLGKPEVYDVVASPDYLARHGRPDTPADLSGHDCIRIRFPSGVIFSWRFEVEGAEFVMTPEGRLILNDARHVVSAAIAGAGIARLARHYTEPHVRSGRLVRLLEDYAATLPAWHIYYPSRRYVPPALRVFLDFYRGVLDRG